MAQACARVHPFDPDRGRRPPLLMRHVRPAGRRLALTPEEEASLIWEVYRNELGYPEEFRKELMQPEWHSREERRVASMLELCFRQRGQVAHVAVEWPVYWQGLEAGEYPVGPDVMVCLGLEMAPIAQRDGTGPARDESYRVWEHGGRPPDFALEIASRRTWRNDVSRRRRGKLTKYESLGVPEYLVADVRGRWMKPVLRMWRRRNGGLEELLPDEQGRFRSEVLELDIGINDSHLVFYQPGGSRLPTLDEALAEERARAKEEQRRAGVERARAEEEQRRAGVERARADAAELEVERLRRELEMLRSSGTSSR